MSDVAISNFEALQADELGLMRAMVAPIIARPEQFAESFYKRVFDAAPGLRALFSTDMQAQQVKLAQMLTVLVGGLDDPQSLSSTLRAMGAAHRGYGAKPMHYRVVCTALLGALIAANGGELAPRTEHNWSRLLVWASHEMLLSAGSAAGPAQKFGSS